MEKYVKFDYKTVSLSDIMVDNIKWGLNKCTTILIITMLSKKFKVHQTN